MKPIENLHLSEQAQSFLGRAKNYLDKGQLDRAKLVVDRAKQEVDSLFEMCLKLEKLSKERMMTKRCCYCDKDLEEVPNGGVPNGANSVSMPGRFLFGDTEEEEDIQWQITFRVNPVNKYPEGRRPVVCLNCMDKLCRRAVKLLLKCLDEDPNEIEVVWEDGK